MAKVPSYSRMEVLFFLRTSRANKQKATIYARCTLDGERGPEKSLNIRLNKSEWNATKQEVASKDTSANKITNLKLKEVRTSFEAAFFQLYQTGQEITAQKLVGMVFGQPETEAPGQSLSAIYERFLNDQRNISLVGPGSYSVYKRHFNNLQKALDGVPLNGMNHEGFLKMVANLRQKGLSNNYIAANVSFFRRLVEYGHLHQMIQRPPVGYNTIRRKNEYDITHLEQDEVRRLIAFDFSASPELAKERDSFVFCCFTGLHHSDYAERTFEIHDTTAGKWLKGYRKKSNEGRKNKPYEMPLHPVAAQIVERYGGLEKLPATSNKQRNINLKLLAAHLGFGLNLTTKIARKTFTNYCLNTLGMSLEATAAVLGHTSLNSVKYYAKVNNERIAREMIF
ncbi:MAG: hypothetical protein EAZ14_01860 [Runella slithyformis]|nr:MAG: hypothetical protein EAZ14_01860 [Runella slithyformis]